MQALLESVNAIPGVLGSMRCDRAGQPLAEALPADLIGCDVRAAAEAAADSLRALGDAAGAPIHLDLHCGPRRLLVVPAGGGLFVLVCDKAVNPRAVVQRVGDLLRAAGRTPSFPSRAPERTPPTFPSRAPERTPPTFPSPTPERTPPSFPSLADEPPFPSLAAEPPLPSLADEPPLPSFAAEPPFPSLAAERTPPSFPSPPAQRTPPSIPNPPAQRTPPSLSSPPAERTPPSRAAAAPPATAPRAAKAPRLPLPALAAAAAVLLAVAGLAWWAVSSSGKAAPRPAGQTAADGSAPAAAPTVVLRIGGAKSFAGELAPALARGYLESLDLRDVKVEKIDANHASVSGERDGARLAITVEGMPTADGFDQLAAGRLDVAMSGRRIKPEWQAKLAAQGPMMVPGRENVVALSGIAIVVNPANSVPQLTREQLADIFSGAVTDWSQVGGGRREEIHVYAGDEKMGLTDLFRTLVLQKRDYGPAVKRLPLLQELTEAVAIDPQGIAYVTLPFIRGTRAVPVAEAGTAALVPTAFTLATEDYPLTHRLYFYVLPKAEAPHVLKFVQFAVGPAGQEIVKRSGYVELSVATAAREAPRGAPSRYLKLTEGAHRLSSTFRFEPGASEFDVRALVDLERVTAYLVENRLNGEAVRLLGFADAQGKRDVNEALSVARAEQVARALAQRGISGVAVDGFGSALPVATNATPEGRERNRRVEVWVASPLAGHRTEPRP